MNESNWEQRVLNAVRLLDMCNTGSQTPKQYIDEELCGRVENGVLCVATGKGRLDVVKQLVEQGVNIYANDMAALDIAVAEGKEDILAFFIERARELMSEWLKEKQNGIQAGINE